MSKENEMVLFSHVVGLLKEYMRDLVEQAEQGAFAQERLGFAALLYFPNHAASDFLELFWIIVSNLKGCQ